MSVNDDEGNSAPPAAGQGVTEPVAAATVGEALDYCADLLSASDAFYGHGTDNAWDEAVQLVLAVAGLPADAGDDSRSSPLSESQRLRLTGLLRRRLEEKQPLPYLLGRAWFAGIEFLCDRRALVPRSPLAELIVNDYAPWYSGPPPSRLLDLCCGGGCIGLAAAHYHPDLRVDLLDIDEGALSLAAENVAYRGLDSRSRVLRSDLFSALHGERYDIILSNPPYVDAGDLAAMPAEYHREPAIALGSGPDGLALTRRILADAARFLEDHGLLVVEVGNTQAALESAYPDIPFTWIEFEHGGHGVFVLSRPQLQDYAASLRS